MKIYIAIKTLFDGNEEIISAHRSKHGAGNALIKALGKRAESDGVIREMEVED